MISKERKEYLEFKGKFYAVAYLKKGNTKIDFCPFCKREHEHSGGGHKFPHCADYRFYTEIKAKDDTILYKEDGYFIIEY